MKQNHGANNIINYYLAEMVDFEHNRDYQKYLSDNGLTDLYINQVEWIRSKSLEERCELAAEYSNVDDNDWINKVEKKQQLKKETKAEMTKLGQSVVKELNSLLAEFDKDIREQEKDIYSDLDNLNKEIESINAQLKSITDARAKLDVAYFEKGKTPVTPEQTTNYQNRIIEMNEKETDLNKKLEDREDKLKLKNEELKALRDLKKQRSLYNSEIQNAIHEFTKEIANESEIKIEGYKIDEPKENAISGTTNTVTKANSSYSRPDKRKPSKIAHNKTKDLIEKSDFEVLTMLNNSGYKEMLDTVRNGKKSDRDAILRIVSRLLDTIGNNGIILPDGTKLERKDLENITKLNKDRKNKINDYIRRHEEDYDKLRKDDKTKVDEILKYLKLGVIATEAHTNAPTRFFRKWNKNSILNQLGNGLKNIAIHQGDLKEIHKDQTLQKLYKIYGLEYKKDQTAAKTTQLKKDGVNPIQR